MPKILVADDSAFMRQMITSTLKESGYFDICEAEDGGQAIERYDDCQPDIVLLDINMPVKDGMQVLEEIAPRGANIIMISAIGQDQYIKKAFELGAKDYFVKPHDIRGKLALKISALVGSA